jgi:hypothetical protein
MAWCIEQIWSGMDGVYEKGVQYMYITALQHLIRATACVLVEMS